MLLPSPELKELSKRMGICLSGKRTPPGGDVRYGQFSWAYLFDAKGEFRSAFNISDVMGEARAIKANEPAAVIAALDHALDSPSLDSLKRNYLATQGSYEAYAAIKKWLNSMEKVGQMGVANFLKETASQTDEPDVAWARSIQLRADACGAQVIHKKDFDLLTREIENFISAHGDYPNSQELMKLLVDQGLRYSFDINSRCKTYAKKWGQTAPKASKALMEYCKTVLETSEKELTELTVKDWGFPTLLARLGRADELRTLLTERKKGLGVMAPIYASWREEIGADY